MEEDVEVFENLEEICVKSEEKYEGKLLHVFCDSVKLPDGSIKTREYIKHNGAVCIAAMTEDGQIYMEHQFRYPLHRVVYELPAGKLDSSAEDPLEAAKRELMEETGLTAEKWTSLGQFTPSCAYTTEIIYFFVAEKLKEGERKLDEGEFLNVEKVPFKSVLKKVLNGEILDGKTQTLILKIFASGRI